MAHYFLAFTSRSPLPPARVGLVYRLNLAGLEDNTLPAISPPQNFDAIL